MPASVDNLMPTIEHFIKIVQAKQVDWESRPAPGKWSNKEIIGHLTDSAMINLQRFVRCSYEEISNWCMSRMNGLPCSTTRK